MTEAKRTSLSNTKPSKATTEHQSLEPATARVHDLSGIVCIGLSAELHSIFDKKTVQKIVSDLESRLMTVIIRRPGDIAYLHLQVVARNLGDPLSQISKPSKSSDRQPRSKA